jgi:AraC family transcriptional activator of mtrCDE
MLLLDQLLGGLDIGVNTFAVCEVRRGSCLVLEDDKMATIHYVLSGNGTAQPMNGPAISLTAQTVIIAPAGTCMVVSPGWERQMTIPEPECRPLPGGWDWVTVGVGEGGLVLVCGALAATHRHVMGLFDHLRAPLVENVSDDVAFRDPFYRLLDELSAQRPGAKALADLLMKECLVELLRRICKTGECREPWLVALDSPRLSKVIGVMLDRPEDPFTLERLADVAGMSRASFAEQFKKAFGRTAMDFLKELRLRRAAQLLEATDLPVKTIAARVGFSSRSHFSRTFKAAMHLEPTAYRASVQAGRLKV